MFIIFALYCIIENRNLLNYERDGEKQLVKSRLQVGRKHDDSQSYLKMSPANKSFDLKKKVYIFEEPNVKNVQIKVQALEEELREKSSKNVHLQTVIVNLETANKKLIDEIEQLNFDNKSLQDKIESIEESLEKMYNEKTCQGLLQLEEQYMKKDLQRLVKLLSRTQELKYKNLFYLENEGHQTFLRGASKMVERFSKERSLQQQQKKLTFQGDSKEKVAEELLWVPTKAYKIAQTVDMTEEQKVELLCSFNLAYHQLYDSKLRKLQEIQKQESSQLKRQLVNRVPYDNICAQKTISRLKNQISKQKSNQIAQIQACLQKIMRYECQISEQEKKISSMQKELDLKGMGPKFKKEMFMEGAVWMLNKVFSEYDTFEQDFYSLNDELNARIEALCQEYDAMQQQIILKVYKWVAENVQEISFNLKDRLKAIQQMTERKMQSEI